MYSLLLQADDSGSEWLILESSKGYLLSDAKIAWRRRALDNEDTGDHDWPPDMRAEYERMCGRQEFSEAPEPPQFSPVELAADPDLCEWDQPCSYGRRVDAHAVYCRNDRWLYAPTKCRRGKPQYPHSRCPGFAPNPFYSPPHDA